MKLITLKRCYAILGLCLFMLIGPAIQSADAAEAQTLTNGSWVCHSVDHYQAVIKSMSEGVDSVRQIQESFKESCLYVDEDIAEDMLPPFVTVLESNSDLSRVTFFVEFYRKLATLHAKIRQVKYVGWTASNNVKPFP